MKNKFAIALLAGVAMVAVAATQASAGRGGGGGGGHGGGGGFHGGGGGGFHGGGGGSFHMGGGGGMRMGGSSVRMGGGGMRMGGAGFRAGGASSFRGATVHAPAARSFTTRGPAGAAAVRGTAGGLNRSFVGRAGAVGAGAALGAAAAHGAFAHSVTHTQFAHNQFAAQNFRGFQNFNRGGFNRNAFGNPAGWNHWGGRFWGAGWHRWGYGWGGWAGPVFWPYLWGDFFSFAFWPYDYYDPFWGYGPDFVLVSIFAPGPYFGPDYGYAPDYGYVPGPGNGGGGQIYYGGAGGAPAANTITKADRDALAETNTAAIQSCNGLAPGVSDLPFDKIKSTVRPTGDQLTALEALQAAALKAQDAVKASCPTAVPLTPVARLDAAEGRLESMIEAVQVMRDPLQRFYDSLDDQQKQRFESMNSNSGAKAPAGGNLAALCSQQSGDVAKVPVDRIEQVVAPNGQQQQDAFNALKQASHDIADQLAPSCPKDVPQTPVARVDAVKTRLDAMVAAMKTIRPKLADFYASLSDEQKAKFNIMGPAQSASAEAPPANN
jgi:hypothetical protein